MEASIPYFLQSVTEIEQNSWWAGKIGPKLRPISFTYSIRDGQESITEVPKEAFESLLLRVRRLTMNDSPEQLHLVRKLLKKKGTHDLNRHLLDVWHKYWRLAFIKEPFEIEQTGRRKIMTRYKVYDCFINGRYFHTSVPEYNVVLYGSERPIQIARTYLFFENMFHSVVVDLGFCAIALHRFINNAYSFADMPLDGLNTAFAFMMWRNKVDQLDVQYKLFNDWIETHGGGRQCRWK